MRKIKFRGKELNGQYICGWFAMKFNDDGDYVPVIIWDAENPAYYSEVYPESIAQLVGYDSEGKEVYEGDKVVDKYGHEMTAELSAFGVGRHGHFRVDWDCKGFEFKLKEGIKNA